MRTVVGSLRSSDGQGSGLVECERGNVRVREGKGVSEVLRSGRSSISHSTCMFILEAPLLSGIYNRRQSSGGGPGVEAKLTSLDRIKISPESEATTSACCCYGAGSDKQKPSPDDVCTVQ